MVATAVNTLRSASAPHAVGAVENMRQIAPAPGVVTMVESIRQIADARAVAATGDCHSTRVPLTRQPHEDAEVRQVS